MRLSIAFGSLCSRRLLGAIVLAALALSACSGGNVTLPRALAPMPYAPATTAPPAPAATTTIHQPGSVTLPIGSTIAANSLTAVNSLGSARVQGSGSFTNTAFSAAPQLTVVTGPVGKPLMLGFVGASQPAISTLTTAEVLVYFAAALYTVPEPQRDTILASLPTLPGIATVQNAIANAIVANPKEDLAADPTVSSSVSALIAALETSSAMRLPASAGFSQLRTLARGRHPDEVTVAPTAGSGVVLNTDFPDGIDFQNTYRRSAEAFVDEVSHVPNGATQPVVDQAPDTNAPIAIAAVNGLTGLLGTIGDILNGATAGTLTDTSIVPLANVAGASQTKYRVMIVGPGRGSGATSTLTAVEARAQVTISSTFLVTDVLLPFVAAVALPVNAAANPSSASATAITRVVAGLSAVPAFATAASTGDLTGALAAAVNTIASDGVLQRAIVDAVLASFATTVAGYSAAAAIGKFFTEVTAPFDLAIYVVDKALVAKDLYGSDRADLYAVTVLPTKVSISPPSVSLSNLDITPLTTSVLNALTLAAGETLDYAYECVGDDGTLTDGTKTIACARGGSTLSSTSALTYYSANGEGTGTDTVTVTVTEVSGGVTKTTIGTAGATIAVGPPSLSITPSQSIANGQSVPITATLVTAGTPPPGTISYKWSTAGSAGVLTDPQSSAQNNFTTSSATVNYTGNASGGGRDTIAVAAILTNGSSVTNLGEAVSTTISLSSTSIRIQPFSQNVGNSGTVTLYAAIQTGTGAVPAGTLTYTWQNETGSYGSLIDPDTNEKSNSFTTTASVVSYAASADGAGTDSISVSVTLTNGTQVEQLGSPAAPATVTVVGPSPSPSPSPSAACTTADELWVFSSGPVCEGVSNGVIPASMTVGENGFGATVNFTSPWNGPGGPLTMQAGTGSPYDISSPASMPFVPICTSSSSPTANVGCRYLSFNLPNPSGSLNVSPYVQFVVTQSGTTLWDPNDPIRYTECFLWFYSRQTNWLEQAEGPIDPNDPTSVTLGYNQGEFQPAASFESRTPPQLYQTVYALTCGNYNIGYVRRR